MLNVTEVAGAQLAQKLADKQASGDMAVRFVRKRKGRGWAMRVDNTAANDVKFAHAGKTVLALDAKVARLLTNKTLDVRNTATGPRLLLR
jgi:Fe-S cluster assembly iron-binding protein IscA